MRRMQVYTNPNDGPETPPIFRNGFPMVIVLLAVAITIVSLIQFSAPENTYQWMIATAAIIGGPDFEGLVRPWGDFAPYVLHTFLHGGAFHLIMNMVMLIALGPIVAQALGKGLTAALVFLLFFATCAIGGGGLQMLWFNLAAENGVALGASSAVSGLFPAVGYARDGLKGAWSLSVPWIILNIILAFMGGNVAGMNLAWAAHLGGLAAGFLFPLFLILARSR